MTISGERTEQLDIFSHITGFTSDFLSFIVVELIRFFHGAIITPLSYCNCSYVLLFLIACFIYTLRTILIIIVIICSLSSAFHRASSLAASSKHTPSTPPHGPSVLDSPFALPWKKILWRSPNPWNSFAFQKFISTIPFDVEKNRWIRRWDYLFQFWAAVGDILPDNYGFGGMTVSNGVPA